jgi:hypothetical protein
MSCHVRCVTLSPQHGASSGCGWKDGLQEWRVDQWKESIIVPFHKQGDKSDCDKYNGISLLSTSYKILSNILLSRLSPYIDEIIGDHQCGFQCNRSTTDKIFCIRQILEKNGSEIRRQISYSKSSREPMIQ